MALFQLYRTVYFLQQSLLRAVLDRRSSNDQTFLTSQTFNRLDTILCSLYTPDGCIKIPTIGYTIAQVLVTFLSVSESLVAKEERERISRYFAVYQLLICLQHDRDKVSYYILFSSVNIFIKLELFFL